MLVGVGIPTRAIAAPIKNGTAKSGPTNGIHNICKPPFTDSSVLASNFLNGHQLSYMDFVMIIDAMVLLVLTRVR